MLGAPLLLALEKDEHEDCIGEALPSPASVALCSWRRQIESFSRLRRGTSENCSQPRFEFE